MKIEELIGKGKPFEPPFRIINDYVEDNIGNIIVCIDDLCLGNVEQCRPMAEHIVDFLNQKWK